MLILNENTFGQLVQSRNPAKTHVHNTTLCLKLLKQVRLGVDSKKSSEDQVTDYSSNLLLDSLYAVSQLRLRLEAQLAHPVRLVRHARQVRESHAAVARYRNHGPVLGGSDALNLAQGGRALLIHLFLGQPPERVAGVGVRDVIRRLRDASRQENVRLLRRRQDSRRRRRRQTVRV